MEVTLTSKEKIIDIVKQTSEVLKVFDKEIKDYKDLKKLYNALETIKYNAAEVIALIERDGMYDPKAQTIVYYDEIICGEQLWN